MNYQGKSLIGQWQCFQSFQKKKKKSFFSLVILKHFLSLMDENNEGLAQVLKEMLMAVGLT